MDTSQQSILDHLEELRFRILWSLLAILVAFLPALAIAPGALDALIRFACPDGVQLTYIRPMELFFTQLEVALVFAVALSLPVSSFQLWRFVAPALYRHEKRILARLALASSALFILGCAFAIGFVFPAIMRFSIGMQTPQIRPELIIDSFVSLAVALALGFGIMFQLPIVVCALVALGIVRLEAMKRMRPVVVTIIFVLAAILTPPDVVSQLTLGIPTWCLFEASLLVCRRLDGNRRRREQERRLQESQAEEAPRQTAEHHAATNPHLEGTLPESTREDIPESTAASLPPPMADPQEDFCDYAFSDASSARRIRNTTPGRHAGRQARTRRLR